MGFEIDVYRKTGAGSPQLIGRFDFEVPPQVGDVIGTSDADHRRVVQVVHAIQAPRPGAVTKAECMVIVG